MPRKSNSQGVSLVVYIKSIIVRPLRRSRTRAQGAKLIDPELTFLKRETGYLNAILLGAVSDRRRKRGVARYRAI